jgi:NADH-quinone oxidoreductase subunit K
VVAPGATICRRNQGGTLLTLSHFLILSAILFAISIVGIFLNRKNLIIILMSIELMLLAVNMNFIAFSHYLPNNLHGQIFVFFILTVAAAESAIGLAILVVLFRNLKSIHVDDLDSLKG